MPTDIQRIHTSANGCWLSRFVNTDIDIGVNGHNYGDHYEYDGNGGDHFDGSEEQDCGDRKE